MATSASAHSNLYETRWSKLNKAQHGPLGDLFKRYLREAEESRKKRKQNNGDVAAGSNHTNLSQSRKKKILSAAGYKTENLTYATALFRSYKSWRLTNMGAIKRSSTRRTKFAAENLRKALEKHAPSSPLHREQEWEHARTTILTCGLLGATEVGNLTNKVVAKKSDAVVQLALKQIADYNLNLPVPVPATPVVTTGSRGNVPPQTAGDKLRPRRRSMAKTQQLCSKCKVVTKLAGKNIRKHEANCIGITSFCCTACRSAKVTCYFQRKQSLTQHKQRYCSS